MIEFRALLVISILIGGCSSNKKKVRGPHKSSDLNPARVKLDASGFDFDFDTIKLDINRVEEGSQPVPAYQEDIQGPNLKDHAIEVIPGTYYFHLTFKKGSQTVADSEACKAVTEIDSRTHRILAAGERDQVVRVSACLTKQPDETSQSGAGVGPDPSKTPPLEPLKVPGNGGSQLGLQPLYNDQSPRQPERNKIVDGVAYTYFGSRVRERHVRESAKFISQETGAIIGRYLTFPPFYFERRTYEIEVIDKSGSGQSEVVFNITTNWPMDGKEVGGSFKRPGITGRYFYSAANSLNDYFASGIFTDVTPEADKAQGPYRYQHKIKTDLIKPGALMEMEFTFNLFKDKGVGGSGGDRRGADTYYSRASVLRLGEPGLVAWEETGVNPSGSQHDGKAGLPLDKKALSGGGMTKSADTSDELEFSFGQIGLNTAPENVQPFVEGRRLFHTDFISGAHHDNRNGVFEKMVGKAGPKFVATSCVSCHFNSGRGLPPVPGEPINNMVVKIGSKSSNGSFQEHSEFGSQLQTQSTGIPVESTMTVSYQLIEGTFGSGESYELRQPVYTFSSERIEYFSVRATRPLVGMGLIEAIDEKTVINKPSGMTGRASVVKDAKGTLRLGRFGWKAERTSLREQVAGALKGDMGVSSKLFPTSDGSSDEISENDIGKIVQYLANAAVPPRRNVDDPDVLAGEELFKQAGCVGCHTPTLKTGSYHPIAALRDQTIHPYSDFLLHDMGPDLASNLPGTFAVESEWRTPPLWGIGLTREVSTQPYLKNYKEVVYGDRQESYLHDGRARTLMEAILWHGGQAEAAKLFVKDKLNKGQRDQLVKFLKSL